jgi:hypothetical protein
MTQLYLLAHEYRLAADRLADLDLDDQTVAHTLESLSGDLEVKATATAMVVRNMLSLADQIRQAEEAMAHRRRALEARAKRVNAYLLENMQLAGIQRIESPHFAMSIKANPPSVEVFDAAQIPAAFMRAPEPPPPVVDKIAIKDALQAGRDIPGARLVRGVRLEIR